MIGTLCSLTKIVFLFFPVKIFYLRYLSFFLVISFCDCLKARVGLVLAIKRSKERKRQREKKRERKRQRERKCGCQAISSRNKCKFLSYLSLGLFGNFKTTIGIAFLSFVLSFPNSAPLPYLFNVSEFLDYSQSMSHLHN